MQNFLGIVIENSLRDPGVIAPTVVKTRRGRAWTFLLVSVPVNELDEHIRRLQANMVIDDEWYAHYFRGDELIVVFRDAAFPVTVDPASWEPAVTYGLSVGVPAEQLDFTPRTAPDAESFFG